MKNKIILLITFCVFIFNTCISSNGNIYNNGETAAGKEKIINGDFNNKLTNWNFWTDGEANASIKVENEEVKININNPGKRKWNVTLKQAGLNIKKNHLYTVSFYARSDTKKQIYISVGMSDSPYYRYSGDYHFTLTNKMKKYTFNFTMWQETNPNSCLQFYLGNNGKKTVWIDNIEFNNMGEAPALNIPTNFPPPNQTNLKRGIQFGLQFASPYEGAYFPEFKEEYYDFILQDGRFDHIRLPVWWEYHTEKKSPYIIDPEFIKRIDWAVSHSLKRGFPTILNMHWFRALEKNPPRNKEQYKSTWKQIAEYFKNYPNHLYFDIMNEPNGNLDDYWNKYFPEVYDVIRKISPGRPIIISGKFWANMDHIPDLKLPERIKNDPNILIQFHPYYPSDFCFQGSIGNGPHFENLSGIRWLGTDAEKKALRDKFDRMENWAEKNGVSLFNGEFCAHSYGNSLKEDRLRWVQFIVGECETREIPWNYYDFSEEGCYVFDIETNEWDEELMGALFSVE